MVASECEADRVKVCAVQELPDWLERVAGDVARFGTRSGGGRGGRGNSQKFGGVSSFILIFYTVRATSFIRL